MNNSSFVMNLPNWSRFLHSTIIILRHFNFFRMCKPFIWMYSSLEWNGYSWTELALLAQLPLFYSTWPTWRSMKIRISMELNYWNGLIWFGIFIQPYNLSNSNKWPKELKWLKWPKRQTTKAAKVTKETQAWRINKKNPNSLLTS